MFTKTVGSGSYTHYTVADYLVSVNMVKDRKDAFSLINRGIDVNEIVNYVRIALTSFATSLDEDPSEIINERKIDRLSKLSAMDIVIALDKVHQGWIANNFNALTIVKKYFKNEIWRFRKTKKLTYRELFNYYIFVVNFLAASNNPTSTGKIVDAFEEFKTKGFGNDGIDTKKNATIFIPEIEKTFSDYSQMLKLNWERNKLNNFLNSYPTSNDAFIAILNAI